LLSTFPLLDLWIQLAGLGYLISKSGDAIRFWKRQRPCLRLQNAVTLLRDSIVGHDTKELALWLNLEDRAKFWADLKRYGSVREVECQARNWQGTVARCCSRLRASKSTANPQQRQVTDLVH
jgi:hypothetical protein